MNPCLHTVYSIVLGFDGSVSISGGQFVLDYTVRLTDSIKYIQFDVVI